MTKLPQIRSLSGSAAVGEFEPAVKDLVEGHNAGAYELPDEVGSALVAADTLDRRSGALGRELNALEASRGRVESASIDAAVAAASSGEVPGSVFHPVHELLEQLEVLAVDVDLVTRAAGNATVVLRDTIAHLDGRIRDVLETALDEVLAEALESAPAIAGVNLADPSALMKAPPATQAAFRHLEPLARRHDLIRRASLALARLNGGKVLTGPGSGISTQRLYHERSTVGRWEAKGHPVARLVEAAAAAERIEAAVEGR